MIKSDKDTMLDRGLEMPVTTKAQRSAESGESGNSVKPRMCEFLSKTKKSAKSRDNLKGI
jgi:hypothetical protein